MVHVIPLRFHLDQCRWPGCLAEPVEMQIPLCDRHFQYIGERFVEERSVFGAAYQREIRPIRDLEEQDREVRRREKVEEEQMTREGRVVVYYLRIGDHVKIGFSTDLKQRLIALRVNADQLLAVEPGGRTLERERHLQFADERVGRREDFNPSRRLLGHVSLVRSKYGEPLAYVERLNGAAEQLERLA